MKIIAFLNEKGGTGKTTVSINLAVALHRQGKNVMLVDADPQGTARDWRAASPEGADLPPVVALDRAQLLSSIDSFNADVVLIDTPGKADAISAMALRKATTALIVIQPSPADIWASAATVAMVNTRLNLGVALNAAFLANSVDRRSKLTKELIAGEWNEYSIPMLESTVADRAVYVQSMADGLSVYDFANAAAKSDMDELIKELEKLGWL